MNKRVKNTIRLISGQWRGRRLPVLDSDGLRPTTDRVRETLFNWLMHDVAGARCLDLFAGSGALGLECASRGAALVDLVEQDRRVANQLQTNLQALGAPEQVRIWQQDARAFLQNHLESCYDIVFLDPPFASQLLNDVIPLLESRSVVVPGSLVYLEQAVRADAIKLPKSWMRVKQLKAGQSLGQLFEITL